MKSKKEKKCPCGRIITDPKNKTGLCPRCQKKANAAGVGLGTAGLLVGIKKFGPKAIDIVKTVIKK